MTQIIFQVAAIGCCIYTAYRLGLYLCNKVYFKKKKREKVSNPPTGTSDDCHIPPPVLIEEYKDEAESGMVIFSYRDNYLSNNPIRNRAQVYISKENHACIRRFLSVVAPDVPISGYVNKIIDEHLKKHEKEMSALYTECINKPL
mgnify:CR=1 FL=1